MNKKKIILTASVLLSVTALLAIANNFHWLGLNNGNNKEDLPDAKGELRKLYALYGKPDTSFYIKGMIRLYDHENKDALKEQTSFSYLKKRMQLYNQLGYLQTFMADSLIVQLDTINKYIMVSKVDIPSIQLQGQTGFPFEKFMQDTSAFNIKATVLEKNKERALLIKNELTPEIKSTIIYYDPVTYKITKAEIEWWKEAMVPGNDEAEKKTWLTVMEYTYPASPGISVAEKIKRIIVLKNGTAEAMPEYKDYQVHVSF